MGCNMNNNTMRALSASTLFVFSIITASALAASPDNGDRVLSDDYTVFDFSAQSAGKILKKTSVENKYEITNADKVYKVIYTATDGVNGK